MNTHPHFDEKMAKAIDIMERYRNTLVELAGRQAISSQSPIQGR